MENSKIVNLEALDKIAKELRRKALADISQQEEEIEEVRDMFGGKSFRYVLQEEYDNLSEEEKNDPSIVWNIIDAEEPVSKEYVDEEVAKINDMLQHMGEGIKAELDKKSNILNYSDHTLNGTETYNNLEKVIGEESEAIYTINKPINLARGTICSIEVKFSDNTNLLLQGEVASTVLTQKEVNYIQIIGQTEGLMVIDKARYTIKDGSDTPEHDDNASTLMVIHPNANNVISLTITKPTTFEINNNFFADYQFVNDTEKENWNNKADKSEIPTKLSDLEDDLGLGDCDLTGLQTKEDNNLTTENKNIVAAINEIDEALFDVSAKVIELDTYKIDKAEVDKKIEDLNAVIINEVQIYTNVLTLGVKNDGTEDCTIIINDALSEGKSLYFPKGRYLLEYIELQSYNVLIGENDHETILIPNTTTRKSFMNINKGPCQHVRMENFTINHSSNIGQICMDFTSRFPDEGYQHGGLWNSIFKNIHIDSANNGWNGVGLLLAGPSQGHTLLPNQLSLFENINIYVNNIENINNIALLIEGQVEQHLFTRCTFSGVDIHNTITDLNNCAVVFRRHTDENGNLDDRGGGINTFISCYVGNCARGMLFERSRCPVFISTFFENILQVAHVTVKSELTIMNSSLWKPTDGYDLLTTDQTGCMINLINVRGSGNINAMAVNQVCSSGYINTYKDERVMRDEELILRCPSTILHCQKEEIVIDNISIDEILSNANSDIFIYLINEYEGGTLVKFTNEGNILTPLEITVDKRMFIKCRYIEGFNKFIIELVEDDNDALTLNGYSLWVGTTAELEAIGEKDPNTLYFEIDDGAGEEVVQVDVVDGVLNLTDDKYQKTNMINGTELVFPNVNKFTEIHLYFDADENMDLTFPDCKWRVEPNIEAGKSYEVICTYNTINWLVNIMVYS